MGIALGLKQSSASDEVALRKSMDQVCELMRETRPTAVNLFWAIERMKSRFEELLPEGTTRLVEGLEQEAIAILNEDIAINRRMGKHGANLVPDGARILTHCNAGALATAGYGTALGIAVSPSLSARHARWSAVPDDEQAVLTVKLGPESRSWCDKRFARLNPSQDLYGLFLRPASAFAWTR